MAVKKRITYDTRVKYLVQRGLLPDVYGKRKATDSGVVLTWSGIFIYVAWAIFIIYPLNKFDHNRPIFKRHVFPFFTAGYAGLVYAILVGGLFRDFDFAL